MGTHHISPAAVKGKQSFDDVWSKDLSKQSTDKAIAEWNGNNIHCNQGQFILKKAGQQLNLFSDATL